MKKIVCNKYTTLPEICRKLGFPVTETFSVKSHLYNHFSVVPNISFEEACRYAKEYVDKNYSKQYYFCKARDNILCIKFKSLYSHKIKAITKATFCGMSNETFDSDIGAALALSRQAKMPPLPPALSDYLGIST